MAYQSDALFLNPQSIYSLAIMEQLNEQDCDPSRRK